MTDRRICRATWCVVYHDFREPLSNNVFSLLCTRDIDYIIHNGAETHVRRSLEDPIGTFNMFSFS